MMRLLLLLAAAFLCAVPHHALASFPPTTQISSYRVGQGGNTQFATAQLACNGAATSGGSSATGVLVNFVAIPNSTELFATCQIWKEGAIWSQAAIHYSSSGVGCPANSTLVNGACTCAATHNQVGSSCVAKAVCDWAKDMQVAGGSFMIETGKNFCHSGCTFTLAPDAGSSPFRAKQDGKWYEQRWQGDFKGTGGGATNCGVGDEEEEPAIEPPEDKPEAPEQPCPAGQTAGPQIIAPGGGGGYVCMTPEETEAKKQKTVEKTEPDGSTSTTTTEETTVCGPSSCNTTITTSVSSGGSTQTSTETTTTSKDAFCKANPSDRNCTGSASGDTPGSSGAQGTPGVPSLYEQKYPNGIAGVWTAKKNALLATPLGQLSTSLMPNIPAGGSLPAWTLNLDLGGSWDFGSHDVAPSAQVWEWAGIFIIIGALLLARALIFGG